MGLIGDFLATLTVEQEDRVLMNTMKQGACQCLLATAMPELGNNVFRHEYDRSHRRKGFPAKPPFWGEDYAGTRFDWLASRYGEDRMGTLIRNRILANRLKRELSQPKSAAPSLESVVESVR